MFCISLGGLAMAKVTKLCIGESLVGEGNEVAHIDLLIGPRGSAPNPRSPQRTDQQQGVHGTEPQMTAVT